MRLLPRPAWIATGILLLLVVSAMEAGTLRFERRTRWFCRGCGTERVEEVARWLSWTGPRVPFGGNSERTEPSRAYVDWFGPDHAHSFGCWPGPMIREGMLGATQCGSGIPSDLLRAYRDDGALGEFLRAQVRAGAATREEVERLFLDAGGWRRADPRPPLGEEARARFRRMFEEYGGGAAVPAVLRERP